MSDPIADAAAQQQNDPSLLEKAMDTIHSLEAKVEHLMHPEAEQPTQEAGSAAQGESLHDSSQEASTSTPIPTIGPAESATAESPTSTNTVGSPIATTETTDTTSGTNGIVGLVDHAASIRMHLSNIRKHLSLRGFEQSLVADIHAELAAIESHL